jgi:3(or 17)beta-hydroxysteroid dehydrogenase
MNRLDGKVALISGGSRGIGGATAKLMVEAGAKVVIGDVLESQGRETAKALGDAATFIRLDVTSEADWDAAVALAESKFGGLDILVNNAGLFLGRDFMDVTMEEWTRLAAVNMTGVWLGTKHCVDALRRAGEKSPQGSAIVNLASIAGLVGSELDPLYSMTKGGVTLFTKSTALNLSRKGYRIRVNSIHPGVIQTDMGAQTFVARAEQTGSNDVDKARDVALSTHPIGRLGVPQDIANGIVFLASDDSSFMTGSGMVVDGGVTAR